MTLNFALTYYKWAIFGHQVFPRCGTLDFFLDVVAFDSSTEVPTSFLYRMASIAIELGHCVCNKDH